MTEHPLETKLRQLRDQIDEKNAAIERMRTTAASSLALVAPPGRKDATVERRKATGSTNALRIPDDIQNNPALDEAIAKSLPANYNFEVKKTLWRMRRCGARRVALQLPEGLQQFACPLSDIFETFATQPELEEVVILGDVTYGACCVDDFGATALKCDLLVHYGHSCLVPIDVVKKSNNIEVMYVFVEISFDVAHLVECLKLTFPDAKSAHLVMMGTIQFSGALHQAKTRLDQFYTHPVVVPQAKPLSGGEVLGCTSPTLARDSADALVFVADGRFHLESAMIANPWLPAYRYDPYGKVLTREEYGHARMMRKRSAAVNRAKSARTWGIILGTLGRQGNTSILSRVRAACEERGLSHLLVLFSELSPAKLAALESPNHGGVEAWVQIACPRLSIDWGEAFSRPLLTPYEFFVCIGKEKWREEAYPQDYYAANGGEWTNYFVG